MLRNKTRYRKKILVAVLLMLLLMLGLMGRIIYLMVVDAEYYSTKAQDLHVRERKREKRQK